MTHPPDRVSPRGSLLADGVMPNRVIEQKLFDYQSLLTVEACVGAAACSARSQTPPSARPVEPERRNPPYTDILVIVPECRVWHCCDRYYVSTD